MRERQAFTFVELMLVMTIIALLAAIAIPNFTEAEFRARVARSKAELVSLKMAMEAYRQDARAWPLNRQPGVPGRWDLVALTTPVAYITNLPMDVFTEPNAQGRRTPGVTPLPYRYLNAMQSAPEKGLKVNTTDAGLSSGYIAGLLWGFGPNSARSQRNESPTQVLAPAAVSLTSYDPSNGTMSFGDTYLRLP